MKFVVSIVCVCVGPILECTSRNSLTNFTRLFVYLKVCANAINALSQQIESLPKSISLIFLRSLPKITLLYFHSQKLVLSSIFGKLNLCLGVLKLIIYRNKQLKSLCVLQ